MECPKCCEELDIRIEDLLFPERMPADGQDFCEVRGLWDEPLSVLQAEALDLGNGMVKIQHRCQMLLSNGKCDVYENRPALCREFKCAEHDARFPA